MDLSELAHERKTTRDAGLRAAEPLDGHALLAQLGGEVALTLSSALERVTALTATGRIDRTDLRSLRDEIGRARLAGIMGQQISRFASGRVQVSRERLDLTALMREALHQRGRETEARGIEICALLAPAEVMSDTTLVFSLLQSLLDWGFEHAVARIDLRLDLKSLPAQASLKCSFAYRHVDPTDPVDVPRFTDSESGLDTMSWCLLQQTAVALGLSLQRKDEEDRTRLTLDFPGTLQPRTDDTPALELDNPSRHFHHSQPLVGRHVLVVASRREVRNVVRDALRPMGLMIDFVNSVDEAAAFCREGLPHALVYEAGLAGARFERLRDELLAEVPALAFVQIAEHGKGFEVLNVGGRQLASVGRDTIIQSLPAAMLFELSRSG